MNYFEIRFFIEPFEEYISDVLAQELGELGFDSFATTEQTLDAYIPENSFDEVAMHVAVSTLSPVSIQIFIPAFLNISKLILTSS